MSFQNTATATSWSGEQQTFQEAYAIAARLPKVELHLHLDGSLPAEFIHERASARGIDCPPVREIRQFLHNWKRQAYKADPMYKSGAGKNWGVFDFCNQMLQTKDELQEATRRVVMDRAAANVVHCEVRFCPQLHTLEGLGLEEVVEAVCQGWQAAVSQCSAAEQPVVLSGGIILCALRSLPAEHSMETAQLAKRFLFKAGVVGFDIAGDEGSFPLYLHRPAIEYAKSHGVPVTVHAGEWTQGTLPNIHLALELGVHRIGHGLALVQCPDTCRRVAEAGVTVECCITGNIKPWMAGAPKSYAEHPIAAMRRHYSVACALSSDNIMLSGAPNRQAESINELARLVHSVGFSWPEAREVMLAGAAAVFLPPADKAAFLVRYQALLDEAWASNVP